MVAPDEPVPDRRKTKRLPSVNRKRTPCLDATLPSIGSVYLKSSALSSLNSP